MTVKTCKWITTINPQITHEKKRTEAHLKEGNEKADDSDRVAGEWLLASPCFNDWLCHQDNRLWYRGSAGVGETILVSSIINEVRRYTAEKEYQFAYFYIIYTKDYTVYDVLASLCVQILKHMEPLPSYVTNLWRRRNHGRETL
ncbi:NACHT domain protein [Ceratocystis lukuohia]|uniref:NACHT domain protein n=1 Tax=Ceratocystis lukuohia TaxID=2019550 RepID=A0ABR4MN04_9PEZI